MLILPRAFGKQLYCAILDYSSTRLITVEFEASFWKLSLMISLVRRKAIFTMILVAFRLIVQTLQLVRRSERRKKLPVESAQRRPILCFEFSDFMEPSVIGCTIDLLFLLVFSLFCL